MSKLPKAIWEGEFNIGGVTLHCSVLDNGQRVIDLADIEAFFCQVDPDMKDIDKAEMERFAAWSKEE
jgi:hypothetical protein